MRVLVLGGTGVISRAIVRLLLEGNHEVTVFNRGLKNVSLGKEVQVLQGDRTNREEFERRMQKLSFDAVIDMICYNKDDARSTIRAFEGNAGHLVICSSASVYKRPCKTLPIKEESEELFDNPDFAYAYEKAEMERYVMEYSESGLSGTTLSEARCGGKLPVTIIRPSLTFGEGAANIGVLRQNYGIIDRIRKGKPLVMFGDGTTPWSFTFAGDLAKAFVGVLGKQEAYGEAFHATSDEVHIWDDLYLTFGKLVGKEPIIRHIPTELLVKANPGLFGHLYYEKSYAGIFDNSKIKKVVPEFKADISLEEGLQSILEWFEKECAFVDPYKDKLEDELVELYDNWKARFENL